MSDHLFSVKDQVVLVSGGSRGIGRAIATEFAAREARVVITGRDRSTLEQTASAISSQHAAVLPIVCDVAETNALRAMVEQVVSEFGRIDTLVNVAGVGNVQVGIHLTERCRLAGRFINDGFDGF